MSFVQKAIEKLQNQKAGGAPSTNLPGSDLAGLVIPPPLPAFAPAQFIELEPERLRAAGLLVATDQERRVAEQFRRIKRPLLRNVRSRAADAADDPRLVLVASALSGEGKSFTAANLAFGLSLEQGCSVVLVDADVPNPHLSRSLGLEDAPGLLDLLADPSVDPEEYVVGTNYPSLFVIPAGQRSELANELLESERMREVCATLLQRSPDRILLFDSAPLLMTNEGVAIAHTAGQVLLVVRAGVTPCAAVQDAVAALGNKNIGLVLNQASAALVGDSYYGYGSYGLEPNRR